MKYIKLFENYTEEEDFEFLYNVKDILLEYAEKYDLVETEPNLETDDTNRNGVLSCGLVKPNSVLQENYVEVLFKIKDKNSAAKFIYSDLDRAIKRLNLHRYKVEKVRSTSFLNYSLYYQLYIYRQ